MLMIIWLGLLRKKSLNKIKKIEKVLAEKRFSFDVWEKDGKGYVLVQSCIHNDLHRCHLSDIVLMFSTLDKARWKAALWTVCGESTRLIDEIDCPCWGTCLRHKTELANWNDEDADTFCPDCLVEEEYTEWNDEKDDDKKGNEILSENKQTNQ